MKRPKYTPFEKSLALVGIYEETDKHLIKQIRRAMIDYLTEKMQAYDDVNPIWHEYRKLLEELK